MFDLQADPERRQMVLASQIIVAALFAGCLFFLLIVVLIVPGKLGNWQLGPSKLMTLVSLVAAFGVLVARIVVPAAVTAQMLGRLARPGAEGPGWRELFGVYQATLIVKVALLEGAIFFLLVAHMTERSPWTLALAVVLLLMVLMHMPTPSRVDHWIERHWPGGERQQWGQ